MQAKHLLTLADLEPAEIDGLISLAIELKANRGAAEAKPLSGKTVAMIFSKSSTRTRVSFQVGIYELGGHSMFLDHGDLQLGRGETMSDTAKVMNRYVHAVVIRSKSHEGILEYARHATIPVINALTDRYHPCQLLADLQTIQECKGRLAGVRVAYLGDGANNMAQSWAVAAKLTGIQLTIGAPTGFYPDLDHVNTLAGSGSIRLTDDPFDAVAGADFIYTDVWVSMGFEAESEERIKKLTPYQVNEALVAHAGDAVRIMHCLPAKRGMEITSGVLDGPRAIIWDEAENRLHAQKAVLTQIMSNNGKK